MTQDAHDIPIALVGCDFRIASSRWRSALVLDDREALEIAAHLENGGWADAIADLNTCNRNEWIVSSQEPRWAAELLRSRMLERLPEEERQQIQPYLLVGEEAARHLFRVAIGRESLIVGERQIATQLFRALENARARGTSSRILNGISSIAGRLVRIAVRRGCVNGNASGVHSLALEFLRARVNGAARPTVAVIGLGAIGRKVLGLLQQEGTAETIACNRTLSVLSSDSVRPLSELGQVLSEADAAIVCTGARRPVIEDEHLLGRNHKRPLLLIDIGIPEQVGRGNLPEGVEVIGLDELTDFHSTRSDDGAADDDEVANTMVERALDELRRFANEPTFSELLDSVQKRHREIASDEVPRLAMSHFSYLGDDTRSQIETDLRSVLNDYTSQIFKAIREAAMRRPGSETWPE